MVLAGDPLPARLSFVCAHALSRFDAIDIQANNLVKQAAAPGGFDRQWPLHTFVVVYFYFTSLFNQSFQVELLESNSKAYDGRNFSYQGLHELIKHQAALHKNAYINIRAVVIGYVYMPPGIDH